MQIFNIRIIRNIPITVTKLSSCTITSFTLERTANRRNTSSPLTAAVATRPPSQVALPREGNSGGVNGGGCYRCGEVGHLARDCSREGGGGGNGGKSTCYNCGKPGHFARECVEDLRPLGEETEIESVMIRGRRRL